jgi:hypothetical protein
MNILLKLVTDEKTPTYGYILKNWNTIGYRATAYAYMKREAVNIIEHKNGRFYSLEEIENSMVK